MVFQKIYLKVVFAPITQCYFDIKNARCFGV